MMIVRTLLRRAGTISRAGLIVALMGTSLWAQDPDHGIALYGSFQGSVNRYSSVNRFDPVIGWKFNRMFEVDFGAPVYFVSPRGTTATSGDSLTGLGNIFANLKLTLASPKVQFASTLTGTAPTGDEDKGLSTGRATVNWSNTISGNVKWLAPFATLSLANSVSDTSFYVRPFTSLGLVGQIDAGTSVWLGRYASVGASGYAILPTGEQTIVSRLIRNPKASSGTASSPGTATSPGTPSTPGTPPSPGNGASGRSTGRGSRPQATYTETTITVGDAELAKDHGVSGWFNVSPKPYLSFWVAFTHSAPYDVNSVSFGTSIDMGWLIRHPREE